MESFEFPGVWWIPNDPTEAKFYGPLSFDPKKGGKLSLTFDDAGAEHPVFESSRDQCIPIVHGKIDGRKVTLIRCHKRYSSGSNRDIARDAYTQTAIIWTDYVFLGVHFRSLQDIAFNWMSASYTHLDNWLGIQRLAHDEDGEPYMKPFEGVATSTSDGLYILLYRASYENIETNIAPNPEVLIVEIQSDDKMGLGENVNDDADAGNTLIPYIDRYVRDFLNLVTGEPNYPFNIATRSPYNEKQLVKIFYRIPGFDPDARRRVEVSLTVNYEFIESNFPTYLRTWIEKSKALRSACDLYFKRYFLSNIDVRTQFLFLVQAVEAYHRSLHKDVYIEPEDYEPLRRILELVITFQFTADFVQTWSEKEYEADTIKSLMSKLNDTVEHGNQYSLRKRLNVIRTDILKGNEKIVKELLQNPSDFVNRVAETRHYLTHRLTERNEYVLRRSEYPDYVRKLRKLLRLCFLVEMGLQHEDIELLSQRYPLNMP